MKTDETLPQGWKETTLGEVCEKIESGGTPNTSIFEYWNGGIAWATPTEVQKAGMYIDKTAKTISEKGLQKSSAKLLPVGTLLLCSRATIGNISINTIPMTTNQGFKNLIVNKSHLNLFIYFLLHTQKNKFLSLGSGSTFLEISKYDIAKIKIPLPPLPEQHAIADVLCTWDSAIEKTHALIAAKERRFTWLLRTLISEQSTVTVQWKKVKLGEIGKIVTGNTPPKKDKNNYGGSYYWATAEDFKNKYIYKTQATLSKKGISIARIVPPNSILVTCIGSIGLNAIAKVPLATNQQINSIIPSGKYNSDFIYYLISRKKNKLIQYAGAGGVLMLSKNEFAKINFKIPPLPEQQRIADTLNTAQREIELLKNVVKQYTKQKRGLMQRLLTGQWRLKPEVIQGYKMHSSDEAEKQ